MNCFTRGRRLAAGEISMSFLTRFRLGQCKVNTQPTSERHSCQVYSIEPQLIECFIEPLNNVYLEVPIGSLGTLLLRFPMMSMAVDTIRSAKISNVRGPQEQGSKESMQEYEWWSFLRATGNNIGRPKSIRDFDLFPWNRP